MPGEGAEKELREDIYSEKGEILGGNFTCAVEKNKVKLKVYNGVEVVDWC